MATKNRKRELKNIARGDMLWRGCNTPYIAIANDLAVCLASGSIIHIWPHCRDEFNHFEPSDEVTLVGKNNV
jgi:hypothetical protein